MARTVVIDASVALGVLLREPGAGDARSRMVTAMDVRLLVPEHFWLELTNVLVRRYGLGIDAVVELLHNLDDLGLETVTLDRPAVLLALDLMARHGLSSYDAAYLALAEAEDAELLTFDARLALAAGARSATRLGHAAREERKAYASPAMAVSWARHGRYLADLRKSAAAAG